MHRFRHLVVVLDEEGGVTTTTTSSNLLLLVALAVVILIHPELSQLLRRINVDSEKTIVEIPVF